MNYYLDTEFDESGRNLVLISIGIVAESGATMYAINREFNPQFAGAWVRDNVIPRLGKDKPVSPRTIKERILAFVGEDPYPVFWGYYCAYDWVLFCRLFGGLLKLPSHFPQYCRELKQFAPWFGSAIQMPVPSNTHNALEDAEWIAATHKELVRIHTDKK